MISDYHQYLYANGYDHRTSEEEGEWDGIYFTSFRKNFGEYTILIEEELNYCGGREDITIYINTDAVDLGKPSNPYHYMACPIMKFSKPSNKNYSEIEEWARDKIVPQLKNLAFETI